MTTTVWTVKAVDVVTGASPVTVAGAAVRSVTWTLNEADTADIDLRTIDADLAYFLDPTKEIQIWRDAEILFWGPVVRVEMDADSARIQCAGAWWYFTRRFFGKADRENLLTDGDFELGASAWTAVGVTAVIDTTRHANGTQSIKLTASPQNHDKFFRQIYTKGVGGHPLGDLLTLTGHVFLQSAGYLGTSLDTRGLYAEHRDGAGVLIAKAFNVVNGTTKSDEWVRLDTEQEEIEFPNVLPGHTIEVRLYPPYGTANYDLVTLTAMESLSFGYPGDADMADICAGIVEYAQGIFPGVGSPEKSDLGIDTDCPATGVMLQRAYQFADHANVADAISEFTGRYDGIDFAVEVDSATVRTFRTWHPQRGTVRSDVPLVWGTNMTSFRFSKDRTKQATSVVMLGPGDGPDREEGGASISGVGPTLEDVTVAPDGTKVGELDRLAAEQLDVVTHPDVLEVTCTGLLGVVELGDWCPVTISAVAGLTAVDYRIISMSVDPATDAVSANLNLRDPL